MCSEIYLFFRGGWKLVMHIAVAVVSPPPFVCARDTPNFATSAAKLVCRARKGCSRWPGLELRPTSHRVSFDTRRNSRQLSPHNFVWEMLKRLDRATPATTPVIASSLYNIFTNAYRIVYKDIPLKLPFLGSTTFVYIIF